MAGLVALTYNGYISAIANLAVVNVSLVAGVMTGDANWQVLVPNMLDFAEGRIQRDLDLVALETSGAYTLTASAPVFSLPVADFVTVRTLQGPNGPLLPVSKEYIQTVYPSGSALGVPSVFAAYGGDALTAGNTYNNFLLGPTPASNYPVTVTGTTRAPSLYTQATTPLAASGTTYISSLYPDLLVQGSMQYLASYQRNYLANSNDPQMPGAFEAAYQALLAGARAEESRKRFAGSAWSSASTPATATVTR